MLAAMGVAFAILASALLGAFAAAALRRPIMIFAVYAAIIPFGSGIKIPGPFPSGFDTLTSVLGAFAIAVAATQLALHVPGARRLSPAVPVWLGVIAIGAMSQLWSINPDRTVDDAIVLLSVVVLYLFSRLLRFSSGDVALFEAGAVIGGVITGAIALLQLRAGDIALSGGDIPRFRIGGAGVEGDPNVTAATLLLPFSIALARGVGGGSMLVRSAGLSAATVIASAIALTTSRGGLLAALVAVAVVAAMHPRRIVAAAVAFVPVVLVVATFFFTSAPAERVGNTGSTGRTDIWRLGIAACPENCWTGAGLGTFRDVHREQLLATASGAGRHLEFEAHNFLLSAAIEIGILGLALVIVGLVIVAREVRAAPWIARASAMAALAAIVSANLFLSNLDFKYFWLVLIYCGIVTEASRTGGWSRETSSSPTPRHPGSPHA